MEEVFCKKRVLKARNFIKKETLTQVFSCECWKISKNTFFYRTPTSDYFYKDTMKLHFWQSNMLFYTSTLSRLVYLFKIYNCILFIDVIFSSIKERNRLIMKGMSNEILKFLIFQVWKICLQISFLGAPTHPDITEF